MSSPRANSLPPVTPKKRCAVYTRKSTDEGLDQEYNSLEAQRDAGLGLVPVRLRGICSAQSPPAGHSRARVHTYRRD